MRSIILGIVGLSVLELVLSSSGSADRVGGLMRAPAAVARYFVDPNVAGIPAKKSKGAAADPAPPPASAPATNVPRPRVTPTGPAPRPAH